MKITIKLTRLVSDTPYNGYNIDKNLLNKDPFEQLDFFFNFIKNKQKLNKDIVIYTLNPYVLNSLNLLIAAYDKNDTSATNGASIKYEDLEVINQLNGAGVSLKAKNERFIDCMPLSDTINWIYDNYKTLTNEK